tara:strand:+ start:19824 stop:20123 length:300 start_codon:yes stop_codon:yes gene_type:complete
MAETFTMNDDNNNVDNPTPASPPEQQPTNLMQQSIIGAVHAHYIAQKARAVANVNGYLTNSVGVAEHSDIVEEVIKLLKDIDEADGMIETVQKLTQNQE